MMVSQADPRPAATVTVLLVAPIAFGVSVASAFQTTRESDSACER
jgi:hypothetical protein